MEFPSNALNALVFLAQLAAVVLSLVSILMLPVGTILLAIQVRRKSNLSPGLLGLLPIGMIVLSCCLPVALGPWAVKLTVSWLIDFFRPGSGITF